LVTRSEALRVKMSIPRRSMSSLAMPIAASTVSATRASGALFTTSITRFVGQKALLRMGDLTGQVHEDEAGK
jgi:hypothetical protein